MTSRQHEFRVIEHANGYELRHVPTGRTHWLSDGVDVLTTPTGRIMRPGSEHFRRTWERVLNADATETRKAYFPELECRPCI